MSVIEPSFQSLTQIPAVCTNRCKWERDVSKQVTTLYERSGGLFTVVSLQAFFFITVTPVPIVSNLTNLSVCKNGNKSFSLKKSLTLKTTMFPIWCLNDNVLYRADYILVVTFRVVHTGVNIQFLRANQ